MRKRFIASLWAAVFGIIGTGAVGAQTVIQLPDSLYAEGDTIAWIKKIPTFCEGPVWEPAAGAVYFTRQQLGSNTWPIIKIKPGVDTGEVWVANPGQANGLDLDPQGRVVAGESGRIRRYKPDGTVDSVLVSSPSNSVTFGLVNDLVIGKGGDIYFTTNSTSVYYLGKTGQLSVAYSSANMANGIEWIEEDSAVYVNESREVKKYRVNANGSLSNPETFITVLSGNGGTYADGGTIDSHGNRYVASFQIGEIRVFNAQGDSIGRIVPKVVTNGFEGFQGAMGNVSNMIFGGPDLKTLYFTGDGGLFAIRLKIPGRPPASSVPTALRPVLSPVRGLNPEAAAARDIRGRLLAHPERASVVPFRAPATTR